MTRLLTFVPGTMCDARVFGPVWNELGDDFAINYLPIETARLAPDFRALFHEAYSEHGPLNLVAFSMGGYLALEFAIGHPEKVASLITICSSAYGLHEAEKAQRTAAISYLKTHVYKGIVDVRLNQMLHPDRKSDQTIKQIMRDMDKDLGVETLIHQLTETSDRIDLSGQLPRITCPALIIAGDSDPFLTEQQMTMMAHAIPGGKSAMAPNSGHMLPLEQPEWLAHAIRNFYGDL